MRKGLFILASVPKPIHPRRTVTRRAVCLALTKPAMLSKRTSTTRFHRALKRFGVASFILDISLPTELSKALSSGNLRRCPPKVKKEIELKIAQSFPRSRLNKLAA